MPIDPVAASNLFVQQMVTPEQSMQAMGQQMNMLGALKKEADQRKFEEVLRSHPDLTDAAAAAAQAGLDPKDTLALRQAGQQNVMQKLQLSDMINKHARDAYGLTPENYGAHYQQAQALKDAIVKMGGKDPGIASMPSPDDKAGVEAYILHARQALAPTFGTGPNGETYAYDTKHGVHFAPRPAADKLVPVQGEDGSTTYEKSSVAVGKKVPPKQSASNRLYQIGGEDGEPPTWGTAEDAKGKPVGNHEKDTALARNMQTLVDSGIAADKKEAFAKLKGLQTEVASDARAEYKQKHTEWAANEPFVDPSASDDTKARQKAARDAWEQAEPDLETIKQRHLENRLNQIRKPTRPDVQGAQFNYVPGKGLVPVSP